MARASDVMVCNGLQSRDLASIQSAKNLGVALNDDARQQELH
jgi:hypothetical protein